MAASKKPSPGRKSDKEWRDAIRIAVHEKASGKKSNKLRALAEKLVESGLGGDMAALKEIGDRLDGRPAQGIEHTGEGGGPVEIVRRIVKAAD